VYALSALDKSAYIMSMLENLNLAVYATVGFAIRYLAFEGEWHFTACKNQG
jgi:hypothetical protein